MDNFKKLKAWQLAVALSIELRNHFTPQSCRVMPGFRADLLRAARSVSFNIAEAFGRRTKADKVRFIDQSLGSLFEVEGAIEEGKMNALISARVHQYLMSRVTVERRMLINLIASIKGRDSGEP